MPELTAEELKNKTPEQLAVLGERNDPLSAEGILIKEEWERRRTEKETPKAWYETFMGRIIVIIVGGIALFLITTALTKLFFSSTPQESMKQTSSTLSSKNDQHVSLPVDEARKAIMTALGEGNIRNAIKYLSYMNEGSAKREECDHIFEFCVKNRSFSEMSLVVDQCWEGKQRAEKLTQIEHGQYKK